MRLVHCQVLMFDLSWEVDARFVARRCCHATLCEWSTVAEAVYCSWQRNLPPQSASDLRGQDVWSKKDGMDETASDKIYEYNVCIWKSIVALFGLAPPQEGTQERSDHADMSHFT